MKALTQSVLAAAMLLALPFAAVEACNITAWNGNTGAATGLLASGPELPVGNANRTARYSEKCAIRANPGQFVTDDTPNAEAVYQARFAFYTGGTGKVFSATASNGGAGAEIVGVSFNGSAISFSGPTGVATVPAVANRWYQVLLRHNSGGAFTASVKGNAAAAATTVTGTSATGTVGSASLGLIGAGGTGTINADAFVSDRSATTPIPFLCRGNANGIDTIISLADRITIGNEISGAVTGTGVAPGQPDMNEDGIVSLADRTLVAQVISQNLGGTFCGGAN
ncbi:hypothetical protein [Aquimonas sp.]|jgi:hypothetical protein|uniref:hypothetical protein n=1 Tax=Aquimonas sp. TaxID=1872588 RepID=UPI0037BFD7F0